MPIFSDFGPSSAKCSAFRQDARIDCRFRRRRRRCRTRGWGALDDVRPEFGHAGGGGAAEIVQAVIARSAVAAEARAARHQAACVSDGGRLKSYGLEYWWVGVNPERSATAHSFQRLSSPNRRRGGGVKLSASWLACGEWRWSILARLRVLAAISSNARGPGQPRQRPSLSALGACGLHLRRPARVVSFCCS